MQHIHLTLVGAQPIPVFNGIQFTLPDRLFMLHSTDTKPIAENIKSILKFDDELILVEKPFDYFYCKNIITELCKNIDPQSMSFNISGGTKIMTLAAADVAAKKGISMFYIDQNNNIIDFTTDKQSQYNKLIPLEIYFRLFGQSIKSTIEYANINEELLAFKEIIMNELPNFQALFKKFRENKYEAYNSFSIENEKYELQWKQKEKEAVILTKSTKIEKMVSGNYAFQLLFVTGWFELEIVQTVKNWNKAQQIYWNTIIPRTANASAKNEIDIIIDTGIKLFFIECKTYVNDIKDLDKFRNVVKNFGGLGAKSILVCYYMPNQDVVEKCYDNKIQVFWHYNYATKEKQTSADLIQLLENEYLKINPI